MSENIILQGVWHFILVINSNLSGRISHRFRDMAGFPLKNAHFSYPRSFNPEFKNAHPALDR